MKRKNLVHALGGIGIAVAVFIALVVFSVITVSLFSPAVILAIAVVGLMIFAAAWICSSIEGAYSPRKEIKALGIVFFGAWTASLAVFFTVLFLRPELWAIIAPVIIWVGGGILVAAIIALSIKLIRS